MQNVQVLLQPTDTDTQAEKAESRFTGRVEGKCSSDSFISTCEASSIRARSHSIGTEPILCVPNTKSTYGARLIIMSLSF